MANMPVAPVAKKGLTWSPQDNSLTLPGEEKKKKKPWPKLSIDFSSELTVLLIGYLEQIYNTIW